MTDILKRLDGWREEQIDFLARLVNQDSGTDDRDDVNAAGEILAAPLAELGLSVTRVTQDRYGDHLVAAKPGTGRKRGRQPGPSLHRHHQQGEQAAGCGRAG